MDKPIAITLLVVNTGMERWSFVVQTAVVIVCSPLQYMIANTIHFFAREKNRTLSFVLHPRPK